MPCQKRILIVEDSVDEREMLAHHLSSKGYHVSVARDGREALAKAPEINPSLILMDLWLPEVGGWEATRSLKSDDRTHDCPIVVLTGHSLYQPANLECDGWLTKPCPFERLDEAIESILDGTVRNV
jgi:two-component system, OmpR family, alkaline phosphatase synthesis response regulator PhoP